MLMIVVCFVLSFHAILSILLSYYYNLSRAQATTRTVFLPSFAKIRKWLVYSLWGRQFDFVLSVEFNHRLSLLVLGVSSLDGPYDAGYVYKGHSEQAQRHPSCQKLAWIIHIGIILPNHYLLSSHPDLGGQTPLPLQFHYVPLILLPLCPIGLVERNILVFSEDSDEFVKSLVGIFNSAPFGSAFLSSLSSIFHWLLMARELWDIKREKKG